MSNPKPYKLTYVNVPKSAAIAASGPTREVGAPLYRHWEFEDFDTEEHAIARAENLMISGVGQEFVLSKDGKALMGGNDFEGYLRRGKFR